MAVESAFEDILSGEVLHSNYVLIKTSSSHVVVKPSYLNLLKVYGMIAFQFDIHPMLMTIEVDMEHKHKISHAVCYGLLGMELSNE